MLPGELLLSPGLWQYSRSAVSVHIQAAARAQNDISKTIIGSSSHSSSRHLGSLAQTLGPWQLDVELQVWLQALGHHL